MKTIYIVKNNREQSIVTRFRIDASDALRVKNEINAGLAASGAGMFATLELPEVLM